MKNHKVVFKRPQKLTARIRGLHPTMPGRIGFRMNNGIELIRTDDIICCEASSNYCRIHLADRTEPILVAKTLKHVISLLPEQLFFRTHQSYLIRLNAIKAIHDEIELTNGQMVPLSRRHKAAFMTWIKQNIALI